MDSEVTEFANPTVCTECFAIVADTDKHSRWHRTQRRRGDLRQHSAGVPGGTVNIELVGPDGEPRV